MKTEDDDISNIGYELGTDTLDQAQGRFGEVCNLEKRLRTHRNEAKLVPLRALGANLTDERTRLREERERIKAAYRISRVKRLFSLVIAVIFSMAGTAFGYLALTPFALGPMTAVYSLAIGVIAGYWTYRLLDLCNCRLLLLSITIIGFVTGIAGLLVLAHVRGEILILALKQAISAMDAGMLQATVADAARFYESAGPKLQIFFGLLTVAMELGAGLALHEAQQAESPDYEYAVELRARLNVVEAALIETMGQITYLEREPEIAECKMRRDFSLGLLHGAKRNLLVQSARTAIMVTAMAIFATSVCNAQGLYFVADDLSISSGPRGYEHATAYEQNTAAAADIIGRLPAGARFEVRGITDDSFSRPYTILAGAIPVNDGRLPLFDPVAAARAKYANAMRTAGTSIKPTFTSTDIFGFLISVGELLHNASVPHRALFLLSDMRNSTRPLDIETPKVIPVESMLKGVEVNHAIADLRGVDVYCLGVHAVGKDAEYWRSLREFWTAYFAKSGATLKRFSMERDVGDLIASGH